MQRFLLFSQAKPINERITLEDIREFLPDFESAQVVYRIFFFIGYRFFQSLLQCLACAGFVQLCCTTGCDHAEQRVACEHVATERRSRGVRLRAADESRHRHQRHATHRLAAGTTSAAALRSVWRNRSSACATQCTQRSRCSTPAPLRIRAATRAARATTTTLFGRVHRFDHRQRSTASARYRHTVSRSVRRVERTDSNVADRC